MPKPEIIGSARSTYTHAVCMVCEEKGIEYEWTNAGSARPNCAPSIPSARCRCCAMARSRCSNPRPSPAISIAAFPGPQLFPSDPVSAALTEQWVSLVNTVVDRTLIRTYLFAYIAPKTPDGKPDRRDDRGRDASGAEQLGILDRAVAATGYLAGDRFTFADINLLPILDRLRLAPEGAAALAAAADLAAYFARHAARPSFVRTVPPAAPPARVKPN